jgi:hypothetical protein
MPQRTRSQLSTVYKPMRSEAQSSASEGCRSCGMTIVTGGEGRSWRPSYEESECWSSCTQPTIPLEMCSTSVALIPYHEAWTRWGMVAMSDTDTGSGFYEEDEPAEKIAAIFEAGIKGTTAPSLEAAGQILPSSGHFIILKVSFLPATMDIANQRSEFVQA